MMFNVCVRFRPNEKNPKRASGRGTYRVVGCEEFPHRFVRRVLVGHEPIGGKFISIVSPREFKVGSRVDPRKIALSPIETIYFGKAA